MTNWELFNESTCKRLRTLFFEQTFETLHTTGNYGNVDVYGGTYGLGVKAFHPIGLFLKLSAEKTEFKDFTLTSTGGEAMEVNGDIDVETFKLAIGYNF